MGSNKLNLFFFILCLCNIKCKDCYDIKIINEEKNNNSTLCSLLAPTSFLLKELNSKIDDFDTIIIKRTIEIGKIETVFLNSSNIYEFYFSNFSNESDLLLNFYPLDCHISIAYKDEDSIYIKQISNYEYDAFSAIVPKEKINSSVIKIKPLIISLEKKNIIRNYRLVINSFNRNNPQLFFNEKFPTLIYFDSNLEKIKLSYELKNLEEKVVFSIFIKERNRFKVNILDNEKENRIIAYKDNIIIDPKYISIKDNNIYIIIKKIDGKNCTMIVKASGDNSPFYLQKNILNLGFIPTNTFNHYYYMEIFKGEEGEIMLHNKLNKVYLLYKIINKNNIDEKDILIDDFPKYNKNYSYNNYNEYSKKLNFYSNEVNSCENGCYLLITYYSPHINMTYLEGSEYTLLVRIWDENEYKSQIVNIPLNEYIFGAIEPLSSSINVHHYFTFIPDNDDIIFELQGRNIHAFAKKGIIQINTVKKPYNSVVLTNDIVKKEEIEEEKILIKLNRNKLDLKSFENQYISFAFRVIDDVNSNSLLNYYYFRIIQETSKDNIIIYPLYINKVNLCQTTEIGKHYLCYFLLKNDYKELKNNFSIYARGLEEEEATFYNIWPINQIDYYSIDINNIKEVYKNMNISKDKGGYFNLFFNETVKFILLEITSNFKEILEVLFNFDGELFQYSLDIYSYQSVYLKKNKVKDFLLNDDLENKYTVDISNIFGDGFIYFNNNTDKKTPISGKIFLSFTISEEKKSIYFFSESNLFFYLKIRNKIANDIMEELNFGYNYKNISDIFDNYEHTKFYYIKDIYGKGVDINFFFYSNKDILQDFSLFIDGYIISDDLMKLIDSYESLGNIMYNCYEFDDNCFFISGFFDNLTQSGLISFDIESPNESNEKYKYYLLYLTATQNFSDLNVDIFIDSRYNSLFILQKDKYFRGYFDLFNYVNNINNEIKTYYIQLEEEEKNNMDNTYILEFSSSIKNIIIQFNNEFINNKKIIGGIEKYFISTKNLKKEEKNNFTIQLNSPNKNDIEYYNSTVLSKYSIYSIYIIKFYKEEKDYNLEFILDKEIQFKKIIGAFHDKNCYYNFTIKSNRVNINLNNYFKYSYRILIYQKQNIDNSQFLNTTAYIIIPNIRFYYITDNPNEEFSFCSEEILENEKYYFYFFVKVSNNNNEEKYLSKFFEIDTKPENKDNNKYVVILVIVFVSIFIITLLIYLIVCLRYSRKNKNLKQQILEISTNVIDEKKNSEGDIGIIII